jgi:hypothetical protein
MYTSSHEHARHLMRGSMQEALTGQQTYTRGRLPQVWQHFQRSTEIRWAFDHFHKLGLVRLEREPDDQSFDDLFGDCYVREVNTDINPNVLAKQRKGAERRLELEGQWVICAQFNTGWREPNTQVIWGDEWETDECIGGFVGEDFWGSGYEEDLRLAALDGLFDHYDGLLPDYVPSKTGAWTNAVLMGWQIIRGNTP